jgi:hypothetical protein
MQLGYCGDRCDLCFRYKATKSGKREDLEYAAKLLEKAGWVSNIKNLDEIKCSGCYDIDSCEYNIKDCCIERNIKHCGECRDYPCETIEKAFSITQTNADKFKELLTQEEYEMFYNAFFMKKENLEQK